MQIDVSLPLFDLHPFQISILGLLILIKKKLALLACERLANIILTVN